ncbi:MAG TPA: hypothetical protein VHE54_16195 [Puia sp.]|nr:hypothetical protein [Puia sp.]
MTKKLVLACCMWMTGLVAIAQDHMPQVSTYTDEAPATGFRKENLFMGGSLGLGFGSYDFNIGVNPEIGYSLNHWLDVGAVVNFSYTSVRADPNLVYNDNVSSKEFIYGGGVFARAWFLPFLFATVQPEYNWTNITEQDKTYGGTYKLNVTAPSFLAGVGYGSHNTGQGTFYIALMVDFIRNVNSPYNDVYGHPMPVLRAGFDVFLHHQR